MNLALSLLAQINVSRREGAKSAHSTYSHLSFVKMEPLWWNATQSGMPSSKLPTLWVRLIVPRKTLEGLQNLEGGFHETM